MNDKIFEKTNEKPLGIQKFKSGDIVNVMYEERIIKCKVLYHIEFVGYYRVKGIYEEFFADLNECALFEIRKRPDYL